jgi:putative DNA methylase
LKDKNAPEASLFPVQDNDADKTEVVAAPEKVRKLKLPANEHQPPNLGKPVKISVPNFDDPKRLKTCLEVDFPLVPINALSTLEGNAGKPIYQMSKWWARRRGCVFRAMLIAAAMEAPRHKTPDGPEKADESEAHKAVWDVYYANHQKAGSFKHLKVLDLFMGGGVTLVEGSRLGFQVTGVDLNPVAWFIVKNEMACTDPGQVKKLFDQIEAEVKPQIQPYYVAECPRGHKGKWFDLRTNAEAEIDPDTLPPETRKHYGYEGPEVIYTFWGKHGPCTRSECGHRTPVFRSPIIAAKELGAKYMELTCKSCKTAFHAELGSARMAPGAERVVLENEFPFTELSQPFAQLLHEYDQGRKDDKNKRIVELAKLVDAEPGLRCPKCGEFAGQWVRDVLRRHQQATSMANIKKKDFGILPPRNSTKSVCTYLLIHPDWLQGSPGGIKGQDLGGHADATPEENAAWYEERLKNLKLIEVRGRIKLADDTSSQSEVAAESVEVVQTAAAVAVEEVVEEAGGEGEDRKLYGIPRFIRLADGRVIDTRTSTVPKNSFFTCGRCGHPQDFRTSVQNTERSAPVAPYAIQGYCPTCDAEGHIYGGRFFAEVSPSDTHRLNSAEAEWARRRDADLAAFWPRETIPDTYMTHQANFALPKQGYTHWWKMFNPRQLLVHSSLLKAITESDATDEVKHQAIGGTQQYLRNQCMFSFWHRGRDHFAPHLGNPNYAPKATTVEVSHWTSGYGSLISTLSSIVEGLEWAADPWEASLEDGASTKSTKRQIGDAIQTSSDIHCMSSTDLSRFSDASFDLVITDPPFGDNIYYSDLANFFYAWLRLPLKSNYPELFDRKLADSNGVENATKTPSTQEAVKPRWLSEEEGNERYRTLLTGCWIEAHRVLKDGGLLAFTFHHSEDEQWAIVLLSLFDAGFLLEQTFPIASDEMKGEGGQFGAKGTEYDIIHVCRKRLEEPTPVSWPKMRQWVKSELHRLRQLLESYKARELSVADIRVILRGKALEFYSRHYGQVFTAENEKLELRVALAGINQLLDEDTGSAEDRPPSIVQPIAYQFLRIFGSISALRRDDVGKSLRGTGFTQKEFEIRGWTKEENKIVQRIPIKERFDAARLRPRKEMRTEIDQAHFLIGAALVGSGVNLEDELSKDTWMVRRSVEAVLQWYTKTAAETDIRQAAERARFLLARSIDQRKMQIRPEQRGLFDDLDDVLE